ncbi:MAG: Erwinia chrysanthemi phospholipase C (plcA) [uncultured Thermomicrobiales bacterium]|uniref:Erwinia chrysanthemi phospholipase C (PlcA) n=1 Tax=uncultured Thermomicrobiales bacterium TaxID=1645740 RepID=A0A6J4V2F2_9BACT|nr:MAG: Erwinia chrysanthemi phospholipase C (plcA) [uncultured Thermomicrobiales bacterium]
MNAATDSAPPAKPAATCRVIRPAGTYDGKQGFAYVGGISAESVGAEKICMMLLTIPPGGRAKAHLHQDHETAIYVVSGESETWYGHDLSQHATIKAGEMFYIPAGVPHLPFNASATEPCVAVLARTDPNEQESVVLRPDLEAMSP